MFNQGLFRQQANPMALMQMLMMLNQGRQQQQVPRQPQMQLPQVSNPLQAFISSISRNPNNTNFHQPNAAQQFFRQQQSPANSQGPNPMQAFLQQIMSQNQQGVNSLEQFFNLSRNTPGFNPDSRISQEQIRQLNNLPPNASNGGFGVQTPPPNPYSLMFSGLNADERERKAHEEYQAYYGRPANWAEAEADFLKSSRGLMDFVRSFNPQNSSNQFNSNPGGMPSQSSMIPSMMPSNSSNSSMYSPVQNPARQNFSQPNPAGQANQPSPQPPPVQSNPQTQRFNPYHSFSNPRGF
jgi:hypothetical protein